MKSLLLIILIFCIGGCVFIYGAQVIYKNIVFQLNSEKTTGYYKGLHEFEGIYNPRGSSHLGSQSILYKGIYEYEADGVLYEHIFEKSSPSKVGRKEEIIIYYNPESPKESKVISFSTSYLLPFLILCLGTIIISVGVFILYIRRN